MIMFCMSVFVQNGNSSTFSEQGMFSESYRPTFGQHYLFDVNKLHRLGICDDSSQGDKANVSGANYVPTTPHIKSSSDISYSWLVNLSL